MMMNKNKVIIEIKAEIKNKIGVVFSKVESPENKSIINTDELS